MANVKLKVVKAIWTFNFCEQIEFEGSTDKKPDVMQVGRGQVFQMRVQVGSTFNPETGEWDNLMEIRTEEPAQEGAFGQAWNPVPPVDPDVVKAHEDAKAKLEAERAEAEAKAKAAEAKLNPAP